LLEPAIDPKHLDTWADYLLSHSLGGIVPEDRVMIKGERIGWPLMAVLERKVVEAGAVPDVYLIPPNNDRGRVWSADMGRYGASAQWDRVPEWHRRRYESMTKYVEVLGAEDPDRFGGLDADRLGALARADQPFSTLRLQRPWVITLYPTPGHARVEGIPFEEYVAFIVRASTTDPRPLREAEERLAPLFRESRRVTIVTRHPRENRDLTLEVDIGPSIPIISYGLRNFPDGEVFTSPDARGTEGEIFIDLPINNGGVDIGGIHLKFERGKITDYRADAGHERLRAIVETDDGARRLGEVALGMNPGLDRVLKHPLFVEKVGGTLHIALGNSYEQCYVEDPASDAGKSRLAELAQSGALNRSAQHVDVVADFRPGGCGRSVRFDDREVVVKDGIWVPKG
jgi:aminopeptidase